MIAASRRTTAYGTVPGPQPVIKAGQRAAVPDQPPRPTSSGDHQSKTHAASDTVTGRRPVLKADIRRSPRGTNSSPPAKIADSTTRGRFWHGQRSLAPRPGRTPAPWRTDHSGRPAAATIADPGRTAALATVAGSQSVIKTGRRQTAHRHRGSSIRDAQPLLAQLAGPVLVQRMVAVAGVASPFRRGRGPVSGQWLSASR